MSYLKALGILRLVAEQCDSEARGAWRAGVFILSTKLDETELIKFFLEEYKPSPVVAPWAGGSGFFGQDNRKAIDLIATSRSSRMQEYRVLIEHVRAILKDEQQTTKPSNEAKERLLRRYRRELSDEFIVWMDCTLVLQEEGQAFPPLLGTGGNDGRLDFTQNFMQRLVDLGIPQSQTVSQALPWLRHALLGETTHSLLPVAVGQFDPGHVGGPNATQGMEGDSLINPWNFVLMIEGTLLLAGSVVRRMGVSQRDKAVFPFTVKPSSVGYGSTADADVAAARGEIWLPLWTGFASLQELRLIFSEGRAEISGKQSGDSVDFARAVAGLGIDRGITSFIRLGFLKRSGKAYLAAPLGRFEVRAYREVDLLHELDAWLERFRRACRGDTTPPRFSAALRRIDLAIFDFCRYGGRQRMTEILYALGRAERELSTGERFREEYRMNPVPPLSPDWISACDDGSAEFRLALALASIRSDQENLVGNMRTNLEPVERKGSRWTWSEKNHAVVWSSTDLCRNLTAVLTRRVMDASRVGLDQLPLAGRYAASLDDVSRFLAGEIDDYRLEEFLWGLLLIDSAREWRAHLGQLTKSLERSLLLPSAYSLLKLLLLPRKLSWPVGTEGVSVKPEPEILGRLRAGDVKGACQIAARRLVVSGFVPMPGPISGGRRREIEPDRHVDGVRLAASLLVPISETAQLARMILRLQAEQPARTILG
jgi:CRISPR-associated protein Csx17